MKTKVLLSFIALTFLIAAFSGLVSADLKFNPTSITKSITSGTTSVVVNFQLNHTGTGGNYTSLIWTATTGQGSWTILPTVTSLNISQTLDLSATISNIPSTFVGTINANVHVNNSGSPQEDLPITIIVTSSSTNTDDFDTSGNFCTYDRGVGDNQGSLAVSVQSVTVKNGYGSGGKWYLFDDIEFKIKVDNNGDDDVSDISLEWGIYDQDTDDWIKEVDEEDNFDLDSGDDDTYTISFQVDDNDLDVDLSDLNNGDNYVIYARMTGRIAEGDFEGNKTCDYSSRDVDIVVDRDFVTLTDFNIPDSVSCGNTLTISADAWNIGTKDQDKITIGVGVKDLNDFKQIFDLGSLDSFDSKSIDFQIPIPQNTTPKSYLASFYVYDEDSNIFENKNDDQSIYTTLFKVGCSNVPTSGDNTVVISADLASGGKAGQPLSINAVITNTGDQQMTLALNAAGYAQWANSVNMDKNSLTLAPGQSGNVKLVFDVKSSASGDQLFNLEATSGNQLVADQPVSISITGAKTGLSGLFGDNWYLWVLGFVNLVLVVLIIVVAVRVARRK
ncbi:MAG: putative S-layer protein [Nanoarchaeota archaeon]